MFSVMVFAILNVGSFSFYFYLTLWEFLTKSHDFSACSQLTQFLCECGHSVHWNGKCCLFIFLNKVFIVQFYQYSGARCLNENLLAQRGRKSSQLTFFLSWHPKSLLLLCHLQEASLYSHAPHFFFLGFPLYILPSPSHSLFFLSMLWSVPRAWLVDVLFDQWLTLFNPVYTFQKKKNYLD